MGSRVEILNLSIRNTRGCGSRNHSKFNVTSENVFKFARLILFTSRNKNLKFNDKFYRVILETVMTLKFIGSKILEWAALRITRCIMRISDDFRRWREEELVWRIEEKNVLKNKMCHNFLTDHREQDISAW